MFLRGKSQEGNLLSASSHPHTPPHPSGPPRGKKHRKTRTCRVQNMKNRIFIQIYYESAHEYRQAKVQTIKLRPPAPPTMNHSMKNHPSRELTPLYTTTHYIYYIPSGGVKWGELVSDSSLLCRRTAPSHPVRCDPPTAYIANKKCFR